MWFFSPIFGQVQTDRQTDRQKTAHMSPPCNVHRWAQKVLKHYLAVHNLVPLGVLFWYTIIFQDGIFYQKGHHFLKRYLSSCHTIESVQKPRETILSGWHRKYRKPFKNSSYFYLQYERNIDDAAIITDCFTC